MGKLRLQLEDLRIDSFTTTSSHKEKGTVFGEQGTCYTACTCPGCPTCDASSNGTCRGTAHPGIAARASHPERRGSDSAGTGSDSPPAGLR